VGETLRVSNFN